MTEVQKLVEFLVIHKKEDLNFIRHLYKLSKTLTKIRAWKDIKESRERQRKKYIEDSKNFSKRLEEYSVKLEEYSEAKKKQDTVKENYAKKVEFIKKQYAENMDLYEKDSDNKRKTLLEEIELEKEEYFKVFNKQFDSVSKCLLRSEDDKSIRRIRENESKLLSLKPILIIPSEPYFETLKEPKKPTTPTKPDSILKPEPDIEDPFSGGCKCHRGRY